MTNSLIAIVVSEELASIVVSFEPVTASGVCSQWNVQARALRIRVSGHCQIHVWPSAFNVNCLRGRPRDGPEIEKHLAHRMWQGGFRYEERMVKFWYEAQLHFSMLALHGGPIQHAYIQHGRDNYAPWADRGFILKDVVNMCLEHEGISYPCQWLAYAHGFLFTPLQLSREIGFSLFQRDRLVICRDMGCARLSRSVGEMLHTLLVLSDGGRYCSARCGCNVPLLTRHNL